MALRDQLTEPWGILAAGFVGGLGGAVTAALAPVALAGVPVGLGIATVVYGVRVGLGVFLDGRTGAAPRSARPLPRPRRGSPADLWLRRAGAVVASLRQQTDMEPDPVLRAQIGDVDDRAVVILADLERLAGQVTLIDAAAGRVDAAVLHRERDALERALRSGSPEARQERERSLRSLDEQLAAYGRLMEARDGLLAKMQSTVLGLDGLVIGLAELSAMHAASDVAGDMAGRVRLLTEDLDGLRSGLADAEALSRRVLAGGYPPGGRWTYVPGQSK